MTNMTTLRRSLVLASLASFMLVGTLGMIGCSKEKDKESNLGRKEGVAKIIDLENNVVSMICKDDKGGEHELRGTIRDDTEVWINGRSHKLSDIREGDRVVVFGYKEGEKQNAKLVAVKIEVDRPKDSDWKSTQKPADSAAEPKATETTDEKASEESPEGNLQKDDPATGEKTP